MSLALAFIAMSIAPCVAPATNVAAHNASSDPAKPMATRAAPQTVGEKTHERHRNDRAGCKSQKRDAKRCIGEREVRLDPGDSGCPAADSGAIGHEGAERRQAPGQGRRHNPVRGKLETRVGHLGLSGMYEERRKRLA
jgi:hypothetical protein